MARRKVLPPVDTGGSSDSGDTRKEQMSLLPGSPEYMERQRDLAGVDERDFVQRADGVIDEGLEKTSDELQEAPPEPEHVAKHAQQIRKRNDVQEQQADAAQLQKTVRRMAKVAGFGIVRKAAMDAAALTPTKDDDAKARQARVDSIPDVIYDDGVTQKNYTQEALADMGFEP